MKRLKSKKKASKRVSAGKRVAANKRRTEQIQREADSKFRKATRQMVGWPPLGVVPSPAACQMRMECFQCEGETRVIYWIRSNASDGWIATKGLYDGPFPVR